METVRFTHMEDGTREEYEFLARLEDVYSRATADRVLGYFREQAETFAGYAVSRQQHARQCPFRCIQHNPSAHHHPSPSQLLDWLGGCFPLHAELCQEVAARR